MPSRMAARSTTHGTPVKSCSRTRAGMKEISASLWLPVASASMSLDVTDEPSSRRRRFSSRIFSENGSRSTAPNPSRFASAGRLKKSKLSEPLVWVCRTLNVSSDMGV